jgi:RND family efflux transporter MFP subunit
MIRPMKKAILHHSLKSLIRLMPGFIPLLLLSALFSCNSRVAEDGEHHEEEMQPRNKKVVTITQKQFDAISLQLGRIEERNLTDVLKVTGFLKVPPQNKANITSLSGGTVQSILVREGDYVKKGQVLATLVHPELVKMQQEYLDAQSAVVYAEAEYLRQKELSQKNISAQKTLQQAQADYHSLQAKLSGLTQQLNLLGINTATVTPDHVETVISIKSPISGNISHIGVNIGSNLSPSDELMDVVDNSQLHADLFVFEQDFSKIRVGQSVDVTLTNLPGKQYKATIFAVGSAFEGGSKSIPVHAAITGDKAGLIEGMNVVAGVNIENKTTKAILSSAIVSSGGIDYIFIQDQKNETETSQAAGSLLFRQVQVKKGVTNDNYSEITPLEEIPENPAVVTSGAFYLLSMLTNEGEDHEH